MEYPVSGIAGSVQIGHIDMLLKLLTGNPF